MFYCSCNKMITIGLMSWLFKYAHNMHSGDE